MKTMKGFLKNNNLDPRLFNMDSVTEDIISEMNKGLSGEPSSLAMIPSYMKIDGPIPQNRTLAAIDAGGTNVRVARVTLRGKNPPQLEALNTFPMPGSQGAVTAQEFFRRLAESVIPCLEGIDSIGFCFSYPAKIEESGDGRISYFSKEIAIKGAEGLLLGESLKTTLRELGSREIEKVTVMNDTVSTLFAGLRHSADLPVHRIGFILGTGTNCCYRELNSGITKIGGGPGAQIVNTESGGYSPKDYGKVDRCFDESTGNPGKYLLEKRISGAYLGGLILTAWSLAAEEGLFSKNTCGLIKKTKRLSTPEVSEILSSPQLMNARFPGASEKDIRDLILCLSAVIKRAAMLTASCLAAVMLKSYRTDLNIKDFLISADGSLFFHLPGFKRRVSGILNKFAAERALSLKIVQAQNASLVGAAAAAAMQEIL